MFSFGVDGYIGVKQHDKNNDGDDDIYGLKTARPVAASCKETTDKGKQRLTEHLRQQGNALPGEDVVGFLGGRQSHDEDFGLGQNAVQLLKSVHLVIGRISRLLGPPHTPDDLGPQSLGPAGKVGADVTGTQNGNAAAADGPHAQALFPLPVFHDLLKLRHLPQHHQRHHEDVLGDGNTVGAGGVAQQHIRVRIDGLVRVGIHPGKAAAEPLEVGCRLQLLGRAHAVNNLVIC